MNSSRIIIVGLLVVVMLIGSLFLGEAVAMENYTTVGVFFAVVVAFAVIKILGPNVWLLIPVFITFGSSTQLLPVPLSIANIVTIFCIGVIGMQYALGMQRLRWSLNKVEFFMLPCLLFMAVTYLLNPVGLSVLGSSTVGSRPYLEVMLALAGYVVLTGISTNKRAVQTLPILTLGAGGFLSLGTGIAYHFPSIGSRLNVLYGGFTPHWDVSSQYGFQMAKRLSYLGAIADPLQRYMMLRNGAWLTRPGKGGVTVIVLLLTLMASMLTGHRIAVVTWAAYIGIFALIRGDIKGLLLMGVLGTISLVGIYGFHHTIKEVPLSIQRSLSFLPGDWDRDVIQDAEGSIEWRMEMWEAVLFEEGRVNNKILGDGFGFSARELALAQSMSSEDGRVNLSPEDMQEYFLVSGDLHSGPLTAVRFVGWVGLFFFAILSFYLAGCYWKLCRRVRNTPYWMAVTFIGIPWIYFPFKYIFLYGDYAHNIPLFIIGAGMYKLLNRQVNEAEIRFALENQEQSKTLVPIKPE